MARCCDGCVVLMESCQRLKNCGPSNRVKNTRKKAITDHDRPSSENDTTKEGTRQAFFKTLLQTLSNELLQKTDEQLDAERIYHDWRVLR